MARALISTAGTTQHRRGIADHQIGEFALPLRRDAITYLISRHRQPPYRRRRSLTRQGRPTGQVVPGAAPAPARHSRAAVATPRSACSAVSELAPARWLAERAFVILARSLAECRVIMKACSTVHAADNRPAHASADRPPTVKKRRATRAPLML